ncbi:unnamed protein product [Ectocarpus fasciculatus]
MCQQASALPQTAEHHPTLTYAEEQQHGGRRRQRQQEGRPAVGAGDVTSSPAAAVRNGMQNGLWVQNDGAESGAVVAEWQHREGEVEGAANGWAPASFAVEPRREEVPAAPAVLADELPTLREDAAGLEKKEEAEVVVEAEAVDYSKLTVPKLKDILRARKLKVSGRKAELIERINQVQHGQTSHCVFTPSFCLFVFAAGTAVSWMFLFSCAILFPLASISALDVMSSPQHVSCKNPHNSV